MKFKKIIILLCFASISLSACGTNNTKQSSLVIEDKISNNKFNLSELTEDLFINEGGTYYLSGNLLGQILIDTSEDVTLVCDNISIRNENGPAIYSKNSGNLTLELVDNSVNTLIDGSEYLDTDLKGTLYTNQNLLIIGEGELNIESSYNHAISSNSLTVENGMLNITKAAKDGINVEESFQIDNGQINIISEDDGIQSNGTIDINNGIITVESNGDGIKSEGNILIKDGSIDVKNSEEGIESKNTITINNGNINIVSNDDGINTSIRLEINGGNIFVNSNNNDALDSNGELEINGGYIEVLGASIPEGGIDCDENNIVINGGTVIATGGVNSPVESVSQFVTLIGSAKKGQIIKIMNNDNEIFSYEVKKDFSNMLFSSNIFESDNSYTLFIDDEEISFNTSSDSYIIEAGGSNQGMNFRNNMMDKPNGNPMNKVPDNKNMFFDERFYQELSEPYFDKENRPEKKEINLNK